MILPLKLPYYLHWRKTLGRKTFQVPCLGSLHYEMVFRQCAFATRPGLRTAHPLIVFCGQRSASLFSSLEQSCICSCLNTGTKTSVHWYALYHIIHSHNWNGRKPQWTCAQFEAQDGLHHTTLFPALGSTSIWQIKNLKNMITFALGRRLD